MADTQWPLFEVFLQDKPGKPHRSIGGVHAPDAEMALLNARDLFVRRPQCHSLWLAPASAILAKTAAELAEAGDWPDDQVDAGGPRQTYHVFQKSSHRGSMTFVDHAGTVSAASAEHALRLALAQFGDGRQLVWWVCPDNALTRSQEEDIAAFFAPAEEKTYRLPNQYRTVFTMQQIRRANPEAEDE